MNVIMPAEFERRVKELRKIDDKGNKTFLVGEYRELVHQILIQQGYEAGVRVYEDILCDLGYTLNRDDGGAL